MRISFSQILSLPQTQVRFTEVAIQTFAHETSIDLLALQYTVMDDQDRITIHAIVNAGDGNLLVWKFENTPFMISKEVPGMSGVFWIIDNTKYDQAFRYVRDLQDADNDDHFCRRVMLDDRIDLNLLQSFRGNRVELLPCEHPTYIKQVIALSLDTFGNNALLRQYTRMKTPHYFVISNEDLPQYIFHNDSAYLEKVTNLDQKEVIKHYSGLDITPTKKHMVYKAFTPTNIISFAYTKN